MHKNQSRSGYFLRKYRIAFRHYRKLFQKQGGRCAICAKKASPLDSEGLKLELHVDHCHVTGKVRGLLCGNCNSGLGFFKDSPEALLSAIEYIKTTSVESYSPFDGINKPKRYAATADVDEKIQLTS